MQSSPLLVHHEKLGAKLDQGQVPLHYGTIEREYIALSRSAGLLDLSHLGRLIVNGKDRLSFLNGLLTNDLANLPEGKGVRACLLTPKARVLADMYVYNLGEKLLVDTGDASAGRVKTTLDQFIITEEVKVDDSSQSLLLLSLQGPDSASIIERTLGVTVSGLSRLDVRTLGPSFILNHDRTGRGGFDLVIPRDEVEPVWQGFLLQGILPVGVEALEILRLEAGYPRYGVDVDENTLVLEAGFKDAVSFTKGCYMGQETVARATHIGRVNKRLVQLQSDTKQPPPVHSKISQNGKEVGVVTSFAFSPGLGKAVGLGYAQRDAASEGVKLEVASGGKQHSTTVTKII